MKKLIQNRAFISGFLVGLVLIGIVNKFSITYTQLDPLNPHYGYWEQYGFPFLQYQSTDAFISVRNRFWLGLFGNMLFACGFSFLLGLIFRFIWSKFTSKSTELN